MAKRFYLIPIETVVTGGTSYRFYKYMKYAKRPDPPPLVDVVFSDIDYGLEDVGLVCADVTTAQHNTLSAQVDVTAVPTNLDNTIGASRDTVVSKLESYNIPAQWVLAGMTWRQALRSCVGIFRVAQNFNERSLTRLVVPGVTMTTPYSDMPDAYRDALVAAIDKIGYSRANMGAGSTLRDMLTRISEQAIPDSLFGIAI